MSNDERKSGSDLLRTASVRIDVYALTVDGIKRDLEETLDGAGMRGRSPHWRAVERLDLLQGLMSHDALLIDEQAVELAATSQGAT